ncbi:MAG: DNA polymerase, partial [Arenimonas sp.]
ISGDAGLLRAFAEGIDVHRATASEVFGTPVAEVSSEQRRYAKVINFGLIYGMGAFGLATNLGIEQKAARDYIERYFARFSGVKRYMDETRKSAAERGYVETVFGRRLYLTDIQGGSGPRRAAAERQAINAPMQGTAADIIKRAMATVDAWLADQGGRATMIMQVHDELVFEVDADFVDPLLDAVRGRMEAAAVLRVPLVVDSGVGANWDEAH